MPHPLILQNLGEWRFASPQRNGESWLRPAFTYVEQAGPGILEPELDGSLTSLNSKIQLEDC